MKELKKIYVIDDEDGEFEYYVPETAKGMEIVNILNKDLGSNRWMSFNEIKQTDQ